MSKVTVVLFSIFLILKMCVTELGSLFLNFLVVLFCNSQNCLLIAGFTQNFKRTDALNYTTLCTKSYSKLVEIDCRIKQKNATLSRKIWTRTKKSRCENFHTVQPVHTRKQQLGQTKSYDLCVATESTLAGMKVSGNK